MDAQRHRRGGLSPVAAAAFALCCLAATRATGLTQIDFISDPGDYIGGGQTFSLTPADGSITATKLDGSGITIAFAGGGSVPPKPSWSARFLPMAGVALVPRSYPSAQRWPFQSPTHPGLDISGDGRGCNQLTGKFVVYEADFDPAGQPFAFAADAEQHCEGAAAALKLRVRYNSSVPLIVAGPQAMAGLRQEVYARELVTLDGSQSYAASGAITVWQWTQLAGPPVSVDAKTAPVTRFRAPRVPIGGADVQFRLTVRDGTGDGAVDTVSVHVFNAKDRRTLLTLASPPGDYVGGGVPLTFTLADGDAQLARYYGLPTVEIYFLGDAWNTWSTHFEGPNGAPPLPGTYLKATRWPFQGPDRPGLDVSGAGRGCNTLTGRFTVYEFDPTAVPVRFSARFVQSCEGFMPALTGTVLFNAVSPGKPKARIVAPRSAPPGSVVTLDGDTSFSERSSLVAYRWRQISGSPVALANPTRRRAAFVMPPAALSPLRFELEVRDDGGLVDVAEIAVRGR